MTIFNKNYRKLGFILVLACLILSSGLVSLVKAASNNSNSNTAEIIEKFILKFSGGVPIPNMELYVDEKVYSIEEVEGRLSVREGVHRNPRFRVFMNTTTLKYLLSSNDRYQLFLRLKFLLEKEIIIVIEVPSYRSDELAQIERSWTKGNIVSGKVKDIQCIWEDEVIYSYVTISVTKVNRGPNDLRGKDITVRHFGGGIGDIVLWRSSEAYFMVGEEVMLNVQLDEESQVYTVIDGPKGKASLDEPVPGESFAAQFWLFSWHHSTDGWQSSATRPGAGWYGPLMWHTLPVDWYVDTSVSYSGISTSTFETWTKKCYQTWEDDPNSLIDYTYKGTTSGKAYGSNDGYNIICWRDLGAPGGTLAMCTFWGQHVGTDQMKCLDADIAFDTEEPWSAAATCPATKFDLQGVGTHEVGHTTHLADLYDPADIDETMYGYSSKGQTGKRDLYIGDMAGIYQLYPGCFIVTAAYGQMAPEVQFLREFRDRIAIDSFIGVEGVYLFYQIYFSFSPSMAQFIRSHPTVQPVAKTLLYPLIGTIHLADAGYTLLSFNTELGVTLATLLTSSLLGAIYCAPVALLIITLVKRYKKKTLKMTSLKLSAAPLFMGAVLIVLAVATLSSPLMQIGVSLLAFTTMAISAIGTALLLNKGFARVKKVSIKSLF